MSSTVFEWVGYSPYGVPIGIPAGDDDVSFETETADLDRIQDRVDGTTGWGYSPMADLDFDGDVDADDKVLATEFDGVSLGWRVLSAVGMANRVGNAGRRSAVVDSATSFVRLRVHDAELGRWMSRDSAGYIDRYNLYQYVQSDPMGRVDRDGSYSTSVLQEAFGSERDELLSHSVGALVGMDQCDPVNCIRFEAQGTFKGKVTDHDCRKLKKTDADDIEKEFARSQAGNHEHNKNQADQVDCRHCNCRREQVGLWKEKRLSCTFSGSPQGEVEG